MNSVTKALNLANKLSYHPVQLLSNNKKTGVSINFPIKGHCRPTKRCAADCYGKSGHTILPCNIKKQNYLSQYIAEGNITLLTAECSRYLSVRLNGVGDLNPNHLPGLFSLAETCPQTIFWGMTRKVDIAYAINTRGLPNLSILLSVDVTSPKSVWKYNGAMCFGPRRPEDDIPDDPRIVTVFPRHHAGRVIMKVPNHPKDCPAVRHKVDGCIHCRRCWTAKI